MAETPLQNLQRIQTQYVRSQNDRQKLLATLRREIKKTALIVFVAVLLVAIVADILSFFEIHWLASWIIPLICLPTLTRRVSRIKKTGQQIVAANTAAKRQLQILRQRLRPALLATGNARLLAGTTVSDLVWRGGSYISTFLRDTAITQLIEFVPIINWLPFFIGQVVKVFIDQNIAYQQVKKLLPRLEHTLRQLERLEQFEVAYVARQFAAAIQIQRAAARRQSQSRAYNPTPSVRPPLVLQPLPAS